MTIKTVSGIKQFQEEKEFGPWFQKLYQVVCTMDNCQPEQSIEPAAQTLAGSNDDLEECNDAEPEFAVSSSTSSGQTTTDDSDQGTSKEDVGKKRRRSSKVFVPINKNNAKKQVLEKSLETLSKTLQDVSEAVKDNGTVELVNFLKEDAERQERRDERFMHMMEQFLMPPPQMHPPYTSGYIGNSYDATQSRQGFYMHGTGANNVEGGSIDVLDRFLNQTK